MDKREKLYASVFWGICAAILSSLVIYVCVYFGEGPFTWISDVNDLDDQRATLWPMLVSIIVTMLGSLITTYVFLKEALDRTSDEKPYFGAVIRKYRSESIASLLRYARWALILMGIVIVVYCIMYFANRRLNWFLRCVLIGLYIYSMASSYRFLRRCIELDSGLEKASQELTEIVLTKLEDLEKEGSSDFADTVARLKRKFEKKSASVREWLQLTNWGKSEVGRKEFVSRFSEWEKLIFLLARENTPLQGQDIYERIYLLLQDMENVPDYRVEKTDIRANSWDSEPVNIEAAKEILEIENSYLKISTKQFADIFRCLSDYRDLLRVQSEIEKSDISYTPDRREDKIADFFFLFVMYLSVKIFRMLPKIEVFSPGGKFWYSNFYNTRFENSAFRASSFQNSVFARSRVVNTNFGMSKFENCEFYNMDSRDCSFANTVFERGNFTESIFVYADFTGAELKKCCLERISVKETILTNLVLKEPVFGNGKKEFSDCKIWNVRIENVYRKQIHSCNFSRSSLHDIWIDVSDMEAPTFPDASQPDSITREYKRYLSKEITPEKLDATIKPGNGRHELKNFVLNFMADGKEFVQLGLESGPGIGMKIKEKPIWKMIRIATALSLEECVFSETEMPEAVFYRANLSQCIFSGADMNASYLLSVYMPGCIMRGANLRDSVLWAVHMQSAVLTDAILFQATCRLVNLEDAALADLHASETDWAYCSFSRSDCTAVDLTKAKLKYCSFADAILTKAELTRAQFVCVNFENSVCNEMFSSYSAFSGCGMKNALLTQSSFNWTIFKNCSFELANFQNSTVANVKFCDCNFQSSNFSNTCFINALFQDCENMKINDFKGARLLNPVFEGRSKKYEAEFRKNGIIVQDV